MTPTRQTQLAAALSVVRQRLTAAAAAAGRPSDDIELLPVTKFFPATDVVILARLGCGAVGEARDQEAAAKVIEVAALQDRPVQWHMVGQLQRNKASSVARWAHTVHSVSSERIVAALAPTVAKALDVGERTEPLRVYVQVSLDGAESRGGVDVSTPAHVDEVCAQVAAADALTLTGLMGIPPLGADTAEAFARLQSEHHRILRDHPAAVGLSAGMSGDLEIAVKHGSTCVRVGTALLGPRPLTSP